MPKKKDKDRLRTVMFSYVGTDQEFDRFLKMMLHNYLSVDQPYTQLAQKIVDNVEFKSV
ncbi:MAG: hypothetical protein Q4C72_02360 [Eubacteriales bacterium]|nr:hypothetical protein [Eubacteriales bacterium]